MKIISFIQSFFGPLRKRGHDEDSDWARDPLAHPALGAMSERELADLPFNRGCRYFDGRGLPHNACR